MKLVGYLNKRFGFKHYQKANVGHKVYDTGDRYVFILKRSPEANKHYPLNTTISYYKEDLKNFINFRLKLIDKIEIYLKSLFYKRNEH